MRRDPLSLKCADSGESQNVFEPLRIKTGSTLSRKLKEIHLRLQVMIMGCILIGLWSPRAMAQDFPEGVPSQPPTLPSQANPSDSTAATLEKSLPYWQKDIVVLVDISASVHPSASIEAQRMVSAIATATFRPENFPAWKPLYVRFQKYAEIIQGEAAATPLTRDGKKLYVMPFGNYETVMAPGYPREIQGFPSTFAPQLRDLYPRAWKDGWTHYRLAQAVARKRMSEQSGNEGYYLFVVSDAEDDPGPPKRKYNEDDVSLMSTWKREAEEYEIAVFEYDVTSSEETRSGKKPMTRFLLSVFAVGFNPEETPPPVIPEIAPEVIEARVLKKKPKLELLGGLQGRNESQPKVFHVSNPFLAWQTEAVDRSQLNFEVRIDGMDGVFQPISYWPVGQDTALSRVFLPDLPDGTYRVEIRNLPGPSGDHLDLTQAAYIRVDTRTLPWGWLGGLCATLALGIFGYTWWSLKRP